MPHLICYTATTTTDNNSGLVYEVVPSERITEGYARRQAAGPIRPPMLPPVVEIHEQILREETRGAPRTPVAGSDDAFCQETVTNVPAHVPAHEMIKLDDDDEDCNDDDSMFVDSSTYETPRARKRKALDGVDGASSKKQRTSRHRNAKPTTATTGGGIETCGNDRLLPPDSDRVRRLLSLGYKRWGKPTLLPNGIYKRPAGRICSGFEFDSVEGLIKPISTTTTTTTCKNTAPLVAPAPCQAAALISTPTNDQSTNGVTSAATVEGVEVAEPAAHPVAGQVASNVATAATSMPAPEEDHLTSEVALVSTDEGIEVADPVAHSVAGQVASSAAAAATSTPAPTKYHSTNGVASTATDEGIEVTEPVAHPVAGQVAASVVITSTSTSSPAMYHSTNGAALAATDEGIEVAEAVAHPVAGQVAASVATTATSTSAPARYHSTNGVASTATDEGIEVAEPVAHSVTGHLASSAARSGCVSSHESAKAQVVADLPASYKARFQQAGFDVKDKCRVTIVSPFDRDFDKQNRTRWLKHLQKERKKGEGSVSELLFCVLRYVVDEKGEHK
jgi:hypothetical protein